MGKMDALTAAIAIPKKAIAQLHKARKSRVYKGHIVLRENLREKKLPPFYSGSFCFPKLF